MRTLFASIVLMLLVAVPAFAHGGHAHTYMGTVTMLHGDSAFMMKTTDGKELAVQTSPKTAFRGADNHPAKPSELAVGQRVVVKMMDDDKTAASVKMGAPKKK